MYYDYSYFPKELQDKLDNINELEFAEEHRFEILRERIFHEYNICPNCGGSGGQQRSCYHNDSYWDECFRCKGKKTYVDKGLVKYFSYFKDEAEETDQSVALLKEFEEKAIKNIVDSFVVQNNTFNGCYVTFQHDTAECGYTTYFRFILNGKEYDFKESINQFDLQFDRTKSIEKLYSLVSEQIAKELIDSLLLENNQTWNE